MKAKVLKMLKVDILKEVRKSSPNDLSAGNETFQFFDDGDLVQVLQDYYEYTGAPYIFIIDEWDCLMRETKEDAVSQKNYLEFLKTLLKDKAYVALAYMTGILPVRYMPQISMFTTFVENEDGSLSYYDGDFDLSCILRAQKDSENCLKAILAGDGETVASLIERCHLENTSIIRYNDENSLACVVTLALYTANRKYKIVRELPSGKGYADIAFLPRQGENVPAIIVELKAEESPSIAIDQIKRREYPAALEGLAGEILLVGVNYRTDPANPDYKHHVCEIEKWTV